MDVKLVIADDWQGLYINDELALENHSLSAMEVLNEVHKNFEDYYTLSFYEINQDYMENIGDLPVNFNDINRGELEEITID